MLQEVRRNHQRSKSPKGRTLLKSLCQFPSQLWLKRLRSMKTLTPIWWRFLRIKKLPALFFKQFNKCQNMPSSSRTFAHIMIPVHLW
ncbi:hypothetical protein AHAS_Ahas11G0206400 [Arachis hypogaea]